MTPELFSKIRDAFSALYPVEADIRRVATDAGLDIRYIEFTGKSINDWHSVLKEAEKHEQKIDEIFWIALKEYDSNSDLQSAYSAYLELTVEKEQPDFAVQSQSTLTKYIEWRTAQNQQFQDLLRSEIASQAAFKQVLNVADNQVNLVRRMKLWETLDTWLTNWSRQNIFVLLGEEGDGKSWGVAAWLNQKISVEENFPPVVFLSSADVVSNYPQELMLQTVKPHDRTVVSEEWQQQALQWLTQSFTDNPTLLLVLDGINERRSFAWWRHLLQGIAGEKENSTGKQKWAKLAVIVTCRTEYWRRTFSKLSSLEAQSFTLQPYDDKELAEALKLNLIKRSDLSDELLKFVRKPRYFELAVTHKQVLGVVENVTVARLIYEDWRDRWHKKNWYSYH